MKDRNNEGRKERKKEGPKRKKQTRKTRRKKSKNKRRTKERKKETMQKQTKARKRKETPLSFYCNPPPSLYSLLTAVPDTPHRLSSCSTRRSERTRLDTFGTGTMARHQAHQASMQKYEICVLCASWVWPCGACCDCCLWYRAGVIEPPLPRLPSACILAHLANKIWAHFGDSCWSLYLCVWYYFGFYALLTSAGSYSQTQQTRFVWVSYRCYIAAIASQTAYTDRNSAEGPIAGLLAKGTFGTATAPSSGEISTLRVLLWCLHNRLTHENLFSVKPNTAIRCLHNQYIHYLVFRVYRRIFGSPHSS